MKIRPIPNNECIPTLVANTCRLSDGGGLYIIHGKVPGSLLWRVDYTYNRKRNTLSLGSYPAVSLEDARYDRDELRRILADGKNPAECRSMIGIGTAAYASERIRLAVLKYGRSSFAVAAYQWYEGRKDEWTAKYAEVVLGRIENHLIPALGCRRVSSILSGDIGSVCQAIQAKGSIETGVRVFKICRRIMNFAIAQNKIRINPCDGAGELLKTAPKRHFPAIVDPSQLAQLMRDIEGYRGTKLVKHALNLSAMLMVRGAELRCARWSEFDLSRGIWRIPANRMKGRKDRKLNGRDHVVPLPIQAMIILAEIFHQQNCSLDQYVFPARGKPGKCLSANTLNKALRLMGYCTKSQMTTHGFRATARTLLVEQLMAPKEFAERQLAHVTDEENGEAYDRTTFVSERRKMLELWADYLDKLREVGPEGVKQADPFTPITALSQNEAALVLQEILDHRNKTSFRKGVEHFEIKWISKSSQLDGMKAGIQ